MWLSWGSDNVVVGGGGADVLIVGVLLVVADHIISCFGP